jgi:DNA-binding XRE family transcriptional regulator
MHFSKFGGESSGFRTQKRPFWKKIGISELRRRFKMSEFTAKKIKEARVRAGITQDEAATLIKIKKSTISDIESAKRNITADELAQFSRIYNVDVRELLFVDFTAEGEEIGCQIQFVL